MRSAIDETPNVGDRVRYRVSKGMKGLQAEEISILERFNVIDVEGRNFVGTLKKLENKDIVFIECDDTKQIFGKDVFVGKAELTRIGLSSSDNGRVVHFQVIADSDGRPKAQHITIDAAAIPIDSDDEDD